MLTVTLISFTKKQSIHHKNHFKPYRSGDISRSVQSFQNRIKHLARNIKSQEKSMVLGCFKIFKTECLMLNQVLRDSLVFDLRHNLLSSSSTRKDLLHIGVHPTRRSAKRRSSSRNQHILPGLSPAAVSAVSTLPAMNTLLWIKI